MDVCLIEPTESSNSAVTPRQLAECCATGVFVDCEACVGDSISLTALTLAACHRDLRKKLPITVEIYWCHGSAYGREGNDVGWHLAAVRKIPPVHLTTIPLDEAIIIPSGEMRGLHVFAGRSFDTFLCCVARDTAGQGPLTIHAGGLAKSQTTNAFCPSSVVARHGRMFRGSVEFCPSWSWRRQLWMGQRDAGSPLSSLPPVLLGYIIHLAKTNAACHDVASCQLCALFVDMSRKWALHTCTLMEKDWDCFKFEHYGCPQYKSKLQAIAAPRGRWSWERPATWR